MSKTLRNLCKIKIESIFQTTIRLMNKNSHLSPFSSSSVAEATIEEKEKTFEMILSRVVIKSRGPGIFPGYQESGPRLLLLENSRKIEPKQIPSHLIPRLLVVFTRQLKILVTTLLRHSKFKGCTVLSSILKQNHFIHPSKHFLSLLFVIIVIFIFYGIQVLSL